MKNLALTLFVLLFLTSCGPSAKLRRANRLIKSAEAAGLEWKSDTVYQVVEVVVPKIEFDTVFRPLHFRDTLIVTRDRAVTRIKINTVTREVYVKTRCPEQTKRIKVVHTVTRKIHVKPSFWYDLKLVALGIFIGLVAALAFWMIRRAAGV